MIEEELRELIEERYSSVRQCASEIGLPSSTLRNILVRGVANSNALNVIKICLALHIDAEELLQGNLVIARPRNFSADEITIIGFYRELNEEAQGMAKSYIKYLAAQPQYKKCNFTPMVETEA